MGVTRWDKKSRMALVNTNHRTDQNPALQRLRDTGAHYVPGRGNLDSPVVFVGEAPGAAEDLQRRPFCGPSGRFFDEMLASIGISRDEVYVTNIVKYRPPNNRDPFPSEKTASLPHLWQELEVFGARNVVTLGRHALSAFSDRTIGQVHGEWLTRTVNNGWLVRVLPLYHPAVALYSRSRRPVLFKDFEAVKEAWIR